MTNKITYPDKITTIVAVDETKYVTAENLNEIKTVVNAIDDSTRPLTNQPTPTTSTVGFRGQIVYDVDDNEWKCVKIDGSNYTWLQLYPTPIMMLSLLSDQTTGLSSGGKINFSSTIVNHIVGASNSSGIITLPAGEYKVTLVVRMNPSTSSGAITVFLYEDMGGQVSNIGLVQLAINSPTNSSNQQVLSDIITLESETDVVAQFGVASAITSIMAAYTEIIIEKVG